MRKLELYLAKSFERGIMFYSKYGDDVIVATADTKNKVSTEVITPDKAENSEVMDKKMLVVCLFFATLNYVMLLINMMNIDKPDIFKFVKAISLVIVITIIESLFCMIILKRKANKFHAAEHMVINAYDALERVPDIKEIWEFSRFSSNCGSCVAVKDIINIILVVGVMFVQKTVIYTLIVFGYICISPKLKKMGLYNVIQIFNTKPPTERELNVAIAGMKAWLENEQRLAEMYEEEDSEEDDEE